MSRAGVLFSALLLTALPELRAEKIDNRNFAIDTYYATPNEIQLAGHFVSNREFIAVDTPPLGGVARFDDYIARYIGFGNWP
jgi:hypothetical protein